MFLFGDKDAQLFEINCGQRIENCGWMGINREDAGREKILNGIDYIAICVGMISH